MKHSVRLLKQPGTKCFRLLSDTGLDNKTPNYADYKANNTDRNREDKQRLTKDHSTDVGDPRDTLSEHATDSSKKSFQKIHHL